MSAIASNLLKNYLAPFAMNQRFVLGAGGLCAIPALDMAICALKDSDGVMYAPAKPEMETEAEKVQRLDLKKKMKISLAVHGVGALILGACAANQFPGSGLAGLAGFLIYARFKWRSEAEQPHPSLTTFYVGFGIKILSLFKRKIFKYISSRSLTAITWTTTGIHNVALKIFHIGKAIIRGVGKFLHTVVIVPVKGVARAFKAVIKIAEAFIKFLGNLARHPRIGLGVIAGIACLIGCVKYGHLLKGPGQALLRLLHKCVKGVFHTLPKLLKGIGKVIQIIGKALYFLPSVVMKTISAIGAVFNAILHPLQAMGFSKTTPFKRVEGI